VDKGDGDGGRLPAFQVSPDPRMGGRGYCRAQISSEEVAQSLERHEVSSDFGDEGEGVWRSVGFRRPSRHIKDLSDMRGKPKRAGEGVSFLRVIKALCGGDQHRLQGGEKFPSLSRLGQGFVGDPRCPFSGGKVVRFAVSHHDGKLRSLSTA